MTRDKYGRFVKQPAALPPTPLADMKPWTPFVFMLVTAAVYYYVGKLILFIAAVVAVFWAWLWLCRRYPMVGWFILRIYSRADGPALSMVLAARRHHVAQGFERVGPLSWRAWPRRYNRSAPPH